MANSLADDVFIYWDNSNVFIQAQHIAQQRNGRRMFRHGCGCILSIFCKLLLQAGTLLGQLQHGRCYQNSEPFGQTCRPKECRLNFFTFMITAKEMCLISYFSRLHVRMYQDATNKIQPAWGGRVGSGGGWLFNC